jgi:hypothetical protein
MTDLIIKVDKDKFDGLMGALDRAESKGYMPDAMAEEWAAFEWDALESRVLAESSNKADEEWCKAYAEEWQDTLKEQSDRIKELERVLAERKPIYQIQSGYGWIDIREKEFNELGNYGGKRALFTHSTPDDASQWISVSERLPEDGQTVVVYDPDNTILKVWPAQWDAENQAFTAGSHKSAGWFEKDEVTHWMPLPKPPAAIDRAMQDTKGA